MKEKYAEMETCVMLPKVKYFCSNILEFTDFFFTDSKYEIRNDSPATAMLMIVKPE